MGFLFGQIITFSCMLFFGFIISGIYHFYSTYIRQWLINVSILVNVLDLMFGIITGLLGFFVLLKVNWGEFRFYELLAILLGVYLYYIIIQKRQKRQE